MMLEIPARFDRFIALDGEAVTIDGVHTYVMLCASTGDYISDAQGLGTLDCFEFILRIARENPGMNLVMFGMNYDVNMMLSSCPTNIVRRLWMRGRSRLTFNADGDADVHGKQFTLEWIPSKMFVIATGDKGSPNRQYVKISDTFGIFQSSFVVALKAWNVGTAEQVARIEAEKKERANFTLDNPARYYEIRDYCLEECELLRQLMMHVHSALDEVNLHPNGWHGAGAIAASLLRREKVQQFRVPDADWQNPELTSALMSAYYGGRVESFFVGEVGDLTAYDIRSAYPAAIVNLPALVDTDYRGELQHGTWKQVDELSGGHGVYHVRWDVNPDEVIMPFPVRTESFEITYPCRGSGWYHAFEVLTAVREYPGCIEILDGWSFTPPTSHKPFAFIRELYEERAIRKANGEASEKVLKLAINSCYGKLAQGVAQHGSVPPYQCYMWAGAITAQTRATMLYLARSAPERVSAIATDSVTFRGADPQLVETDELGGLEKSTLYDAFIAQPGIYSGYRSSERTALYVRTRGFMKLEIDWQAVRAGYRAVGPHFRTASPSTRFVGAGQCASHDNWQAWRTWRNSARELRLYPTRKFVGSLEDGAHRLVPPEPIGYPHSLPYVPKNRILQLAQTEFQAGLEQPIIMPAGL